MVFLLLTQQPRYCGALLKSLVCLTTGARSRSPSRDEKKFATTAITIITSRSSSTTTTTTTTSRTSEQHRPKKKIINLATLHIPVMQEEVLKLWIPDDNTNNNNNENDTTCTRTSRPIHLIDGTLGLAGHTAAAIMATPPERSNISVLGIDRDGQTLARAKKRLVVAAAAAAEDGDEVDMTRARVVFHHGSFSEITTQLLTRHYAFPTKVDGILCDLGTNSTQIDNAARGFTFRKNGPLDMRFDTSPPGEKKNNDNNSSNKSLLKARDIVNNYTARELSTLFHNYADEPYAAEIAASIIQWRKSLPPGEAIKSTLELRYIIEEAVEEMVEKNDSSTIASNNSTMTDTSKAKKQQGTTNKGGRFDRKFREIWHPTHRKRKLWRKKKKEQLIAQYTERRLRHSIHVTRCFQALRLEVNQELQHLHSFFQRKIAAHCLAVGGRLVMIAFHRGEDELVRQGMEGLVSTGGWKWLTPEEEGLRPTYEEKKANGRARSARLRAIERLRKEEAEIP